MVTTTYVKNNVTFNVDIRLVEYINIENILNKIAGSKFSGELFTTEKTVNIGLSTEGSISHFETSSIDLDPLDWDDDYFIGLDGRQTKYSSERVFIHELVHILKSEGDPQTSDGNTIDTLEEYKIALQNPNQDMIGGAERFASVIVKDLYGEIERGHYHNGYSLSDREIYTQTVWDLQTKAGGFTNGKIVDDVIVNVTTGPVDCVMEGRIVDNVAQKDLMIGFDGIQTLNSGGGEDFIYGGAGNDILLGGAEADYLNGGSGSDILIGATADLAGTNPFNLNLFHAEWDDHEQDLIDGEGGDDRVFTSVIVNPSVAPPGTFIQSIVQATSDIDIVTSKPSDGSGGKITITAQVGSQFSGFNTYVVDSDSIEAGLTAGPNQYGYYVVGDSVGAIKYASADLGNFLVLSNGVGTTYDVALAMLTLGPRDRSLFDAWTTTGRNGASPIAPFVEDDDSPGSAVPPLDDIIGSGNGDDNIYALGGNDKIIAGTYYRGNDYYDGGSGTDIVDYTGVDLALTINISGSTGSVTGLGTGIIQTLVDIENITTGGGNDSVTGSSVANSISTDGGSDTIYGGDGNDTINAGSSADRMYGQNGNDIYYVDNAGDVVSEAVSEGSDKVYASVNFTLAANIEKLVLQTGAENGTGNASGNSISGNAAANVLDGGAGGDTLIGGAGNDIYIVDNVSDIVTENASEGTDTVQASVSYSIAALANLERITLTGTSAIIATGNAVANILIGNSAANTLDGGAGGDTLIGGAGNDIYIVDNANDIVTENASEGTDTVQASINYSIAAATNLERITLTGTSAIVATGNAAANILIGNSASNTLDGGAGGDTLTGGAGNDIYVVDNINDKVDENASEGTDTVKASVTLTLADDVENITLTGTAAINATGNVLANVLMGNDAVNTLSGGDGNDTLNGGAGADVLVGGLGSDKYYVDNASDVVTEASSAGTDTVISSVSWSLGSNLERLTLSGAAVTGTGNTLANILTGNDAANTLDGGTGADTLIGGAGNDVYIVDNELDAVTEDLDEGIDTIKSSITLTLDDNIEKLTLTGTDDIDGTGNTLNNTIYGNSYINSLSGGSGNDLIKGYGGNDVINGGSGNDTIYGGNANDTLTGASGSDIFDFAVGEDSDVINDFVSGADKIDLSAITEITSFSDLKAQHLADKGTYLLISSNGGNDTIKLIGLDAISDVTSSDFIFA